jgi:hypothetical protein
MEYLNADPISARKAPIRFNIMKLPEDKDVKVGGT